MSALVARPLGQLLGKNGYVRGPFGSALVRAEMLSTGVPVYEQQHAISGTREFRFFVSEAKRRELQRFEVLVGDLIVSCSGTVGRISSIREGDPVGIISQALLILRPDKEQVLPQYLRYFLQSDEGAHELVQASHGTVQINIAPRAVVEAIPVPLPTLVQQAAIVEVLNSLDEKIELNRRMGQTLETIAQAIFKSWFVDFEHDWPHTDWQTKSLDSVADYLNGLALQKYPPIDGEESLPVIKIAQLRAGHTKSADRANQNVPAPYVIGDGDLLFSWSGSLEVEFWCGGKGALNQHLFKVTSSKVPSWYAYLWTKYHLPEFRAIAANKATTMGHIQRKHLTEAQVLLPPPATLEAMNAVMKPIFAELIQRRLESRTLDELRDELLPKLMSGELIPGVERATP